MTENRSHGGETSEQPSSWREQAVARSLDSARTRAESRVQRFLDAALELMHDGDSSDFTVQEVVERSGQSLRSFYQYFGGKHELLLALFEESVRRNAEVVTARIEDVDDPVERLRIAVVEYYRLCRPAGNEEKRSKHSPDPVIVEFSQQLFTAHPAETSRAFIPMVLIFDELLGAASDAGVLRSGFDLRALAATVLEIVMYNAFLSTIGGVRAKKSTDDAAAELWDLLFHGLSA